MLSLLLMNAHIQGSVFCLISLTSTTPVLVSSWSISPIPRQPFSQSRTGADRASLLLVLASTPFEADLFDNPYQDDDEDEKNGSLSTAVDPSTRLVLGVNKYSHDTSLCAANAHTGQVLFAVSKERLTRRKHDSGNIAVLVESCLEALDLDLESIDKVVLNNHHHRILPLLESNLRHMEWEAGLRINGGAEDGYDDPENLLPQHLSEHVRLEELSHHLAHAYSTAVQAPFDSGLCVVMDGMGETYRSMLRGVLDQDSTYTSDLSFGIDSFECIPRNLRHQAATSHFDWREAESVYTFAKTSDGQMRLRPVFKRFVPEASPPTLYNHGFENMDSMGALYSRVSSHIFGDWNACGKVMGLAPWATHHWNGPKDVTTRAIHVPTEPIFKGQLYADNFQINRTLLEGLPCIARSDPDLFREDGTMNKRYDFDDNEKNDEQQNDSTVKKVPAQVALDAIALAQRIQMDLETVAMDFVQHFQKQTGEVNLCLAGGVALNSVLNGRLARELGFEQTFISPYPGDDGIAVGCCAFGLFGNSDLAERAPFAKENSSSNSPPPPPLWKGPLPPYLGPEASKQDIKIAIEEAEPWLEVETIRDQGQLFELMAEEIASGGVIAWYRSRSEMGPRALGHRSILADPRKKGLVRFINQSVKGRESFRPFAPSVLAEEASKWFDLGGTDKDNHNSNGNVSPYMSMTAVVHPEKRAFIPAVTHVDGSSRLQTVDSNDEPIYHAFLSAFFKLTGVPLVLNTSFNTLPGEPIVESPQDAIRSFLYSMGSLELLVIGGGGHDDAFVIKRKKPNLRKLLGEANKNGEWRLEPACPQRSGWVEFESLATLPAVGGDDDDDDDNGRKSKTVTRVRMPDRPMHSSAGKKEAEWFELMDDLEGEVLAACNGDTTLNEIMAQYTTLPEGQSMEKQDVEEAQTLLQNIVHRFVRLYEHTLIKW